MKKTALKNFATLSRRKLIEQVQTKAFLYGIDEKNGLHMDEQFGQLVINGQTYPLSMKTSFTALQKQLEQKGYKQLLEEVAYTWFNRIIAIRYMEVHEYLPEKVNVLSSSVGRVDPDILFEFDTMDLAIDESKVRELVNTGDTEAAFRLLFVAQCNALNTILPFMFEKIQDYTELLLPDFLLDAESVIKTLVQSEELTESFGEIEVIGWLYQYYIAEEKDRVFAQKSKYKKEEIPFATQLFTPKWIVQYMVQNSLGRYWTEAHREDEDLIDKWEYFIKHEEEDFHEKIAPYVNKELKVEDIKLLDPAMGSGHILVYAFEVFHEIYGKCGYPEREIPRLILENNLYGLDIDDRACQLASFAVVMKAASYSKRFLRSVEREGITLNLASIQETNHISDEVIAYIAQEVVGERYNQVKAFFEQYNNAKTYGSLINITEREISFIEERLIQIANNPVHDLFYGEQHEIAKQVLPELIHQTKIMRNEYEVVVMNPPYMGSAKMGKDLVEFLKKSYPDSKSDLFAAFIENSHEKAKISGITANVTMQSWMFLTSFEKFRDKILKSWTIDSLLHMDNNVMGIAFGTASTIFRNYSIKGIKSVFNEIKSKDISEDNSPLNFPILENRNKEVKSEVFETIPGKPIAYWLDDKMINIYKNNKSISQYGKPCKGIDTGNNERFLRYWFEVDFGEIGLNFNSYEEAMSSEFKYYPYNKGGSFRKWYGNNEYVLYWNSGKEIQQYEKSNLRNKDLYRKDGLTWSTVTSGDFSIRTFSYGYYFDNGGSCLFIDNKNYFLGLLNSCIYKELQKISPTVNYQPGDIGKVPVIISEKHKNNIENIVEELVSIHKQDEELYELSWNFRGNFLINSGEGLLENAYVLWEKFKLENYNRAYELECSLNEIFLDIYQLDLNEDVKEIKISLFKQNVLNDTKYLLSYFVGCILGRFDINDNSGFVNKNRMLAITEAAYFEDDIIKLLKDFLTATLGREYVEENIKWIANSLNLRDGENPESRIRRYFIDEFFEDHYKMYHKRPIYWLVDSGKQKGLRTLIYMHHYTPDTMATIRFEHLQEIQAKYQQEIADLENRLVNPNLSATDKKKLNAEKVSFEMKIDELREFDKRLAAIAAEEIEIELDDGVKVNYEKFYRGGKGVLAKIK